MKVLTLAVLGALLFSSAAWALPHPLPAISEVAPATAVAGSNQIRITVSGKNLEPGTKIRWNGTTLTTLQLMMEKVAATVPAVDIAVGGTASITLIDSAGVSPAVTFTIMNPLPAVTSTVPAALAAGTLTVQGSHFVSSSVILLNGVSMPTTFMNATTLTTNVPPTAVVGGQSTNVSVFSPTPGGGSSNVLKVQDVYPQPVLTGVSPGSFTLGQGAGTLAVTGQDFVSGAKVYWGGQPLTTTFNSATSLSAAVPASLLVGPGTSTVSISVMNPAPGGGTSGTAPVNVVNPVPVLSTVWPPTFAVYEEDTGLTLTGSGFVSGATVYWNGVALNTRYISQYSVLATAPASLFAALPAGNPTVTVANPMPGGGVSNGLSVTEACNAPDTGIRFLNFTAGTSDQLLELALEAIVPAADLSVQWNGSPLTIQSVSSNSFSTVFSAVVPAAYLAGGGTAQVTVTDVCGSSSPMAASISIPTPTITSVSPDAAYGVLGTNGVTLTLTGSNFLPGATVSLDGSVRATTYVSGTEVQAALTTADVAAAGVHALTVINSGIDAVQSAAYSYTVGYSVNRLNQSAFDLAWDATNQVLYASVSGRASTNPYTLLVINPSSGNVVSTVNTKTIGSPDILALSDDDTYLYVGFGGFSVATSNPPMIQRYSLPGLVPDINWTVGVHGNGAEAIAVAPGAAHTVAVDRILTDDALVYDDGVARPDTAGQLLFDAPNGDGRIAWKPDDTAFYIGDFEYTHSLFEFDVGSSGVTLANTFSGILPSDFGGIGMHFDVLTGHLFTDDGVVIDPSSGAVLATLTYPGTSLIGKGVVLDDATGLFYVAYLSSGPTSGINIVSYDLATFAYVDTAFVSCQPTGVFTHITRWGSHGLVLVDGLGDIVILQGDFIK